MTKISTCKGIGSSDGVPSFAGAGVGPALADAGDRIALGLSPTRTSVGAPIQQPSLFLEAPDLRGRQQHADRFSGFAEQQRTYRDLSFAGNAQDPEGTARSFLARLGRHLGFANGTADLRTIATRQGLASSHTWFEQVGPGDLAVHGAFVSVHQGPDGGVQTLHTSYRPQLKFQKAGGLLSAAEVAARVAGFAPAAADAPASKPQLVWYPRANGVATLAYRAELPTATGDDFVYLIDAKGGGVLERHNRAKRASGEPSAVTGKGRVFAVNPYQNQGNATGITDNGDQASAGLRANMQEMPLRGLRADTTKLIGEFVDVTLESSSRPGIPIAQEQSRTYLYDRNDSRFEQVNVYYHVDAIQRYIHSLGFDAQGPKKNGIRDFASRMCAHQDGADNSFYRPSTDTVHFGDGGVDDAEDPEVVAHEYGHALQGDQNPVFRGWGGDSGAMGEGFGDYLAASFYAKEGNAAYQAQHAAAVAEWDATSYSRTTPPALRRTDTSRTMSNRTGEVHDDGEIWSAALWEIHQKIGRETTDKLVFEHHFALSANPTMSDAARELIQADKNINGGRNEDVIRAAFSKRGVL